MAPPGNLARTLHDIREEWTSQPIPVTWPEVPDCAWWDRPRTCRDLIRHEVAVMGNFAESHLAPDITSEYERLFRKTEDEAINSARFGFADPRSILEALDREFDKHASGEHDKRAIYDAHVLLIRLLPEMRELAGQFRESDPFLHDEEMATATAVVHALKVIYKLGNAVGVTGLFAVPYEG